MGVNAAFRSVGDPYYRVVPFPVISAVGGAGKLLDEVQVGKGVTWRQVNKTPQKVWEKGLPGLSNNLVLKPRQSRLHIICMQSK